eukprot:CAMPEP_0116021280 /NCGR_PEP_ID=MMETSP0321-20121206/10293_1 /TAXON_ID=163516 /ORGANISM="Leptocylindrus danicus var. danicus, Strain B650" /LENGTH=583 /DNA_ID=CAMNT_0003492121 /DNA_START=302 /DNA_END=2055 /DNA_ORIENTATION=-
MAQIGILFLFLWSSVLLLYKYLHKSCNNEDNDNDLPWLAGHPLPPCVHPREARVRIFVPERRYTATSNSNVQRRHQHQNNNTTPSKVKPSFEGNDDASSSNSSASPSPASVMNSIISSGILSSSGDSASNIEVELKEPSSSSSSSSSHYMTQRITTARIVRSMLLLCCMGIGASSVVLMIKGLHDVQRGLTDFDSYVEPFATRSLYDANLVTGYPPHDNPDPTIGATESLLNHLQVLEGFESPYCPTVTNSLNNATLPVVTSTIQQVHDFLVYVQGEAGHYYYNSSSVLYKWTNAKTIVPLVVGIVVGINMTSVGIMLHTATAWKGRILCTSGRTTQDGTGTSGDLLYCRGNGKRVGLLLSLFALFLLVCLGFGVMSLVAATSLSDFCIAPRESIHQLLDIDAMEWIITSSNNSLNSSMMMDDEYTYELTHDAVDYYSHSCAITVMNPNANNNNNAYYTSFYRPLSQVSTELDQTTDSIIQYCAGDNYSNTVFQLREDVNVVEHNLACGYIHPIYQDLVHDALCDHLMSGLTWSFLSLTVLVLCGGCVLTLRAGVSIRDDVGDHDDYGGKYYAVIEYEEQLFL